MMAKTTNLAPGWWMPKACHAHQASPQGTNMKMTTKKTTNSAIRITAVVGGAIIPLLAAPHQANAQAPNTPNGQFLGVVGSMPYRSQEIQFCQNSISTVATAIGCSGTLPANATWVMVVPETAAVRCRGDGVAPTASIGQPVGTLANPPLIYSAQPLNNLQCIAQTGTATVDEWFFR